MSKPRKTPCSECPFRLKSLRGYVGPHASGAEIVDIVWHDGRFPCHTDMTEIMAVYEQAEDDLDPLAMSHHDIVRQATREAPVCAGAAALLSNSCKLSRDREVMGAQKAVGKRADVFQNRQAMVAYHDGDARLVAARRGEAA